MSILEVSNVSKSFGGVKANVDISMSVEKGKIVGLIGPNGSGKSTLMKLASGLFKASDGLVMYDGVDIKQLHTDDLSRSIGIVLQDVFLFADSILNNITLNNPNISREMVINVAKEIGVHKFIESLPGGYNYNVKERGVMLSSGQRQLIAFLRVYISNPSVMILDEATSSIDSFSEELIKIATARITKKKTSIIIAHRLSTIKNADRIVVMDRGNIVEIGSHEELLEIKEGFYSRLYKIQFSELALV